MFEQLLNWYTRERRDLPWRRGVDAYGVLVSEIMLQQTRVEVVIPYYQRFMQRFPRVEQLAEASLDEVYEYWAGLGYYRRARNLQAAAQAVVALGGFPTTLEGLRDLPGVGEYTAAAVFSIAFGKPAVALDGNAIRVLSRFFALTGTLTAPRRRDLIARVLPLIPEQQAGDFTQALMELGARLCVPRGARCLVCPLASGCQALAGGLVDSVPAPAPRARREKVDLLALRIRRGDQVLLERREDDPFLAGQWVTPWFADGEGVLDRYVSEFPGTPVRVGQVSHGVTFRDLRIEVWDWETSALDCGPERRWAGPGARLPRLASLVLGL
ncbi:A/G-specific adenine glycosylase [bacterium]|nr:A/G-specific adenine glycosylase [bacterium]